MLVSTLCTSCLTYFLVSSIVEASKKAKKEKAIIAESNRTKAEEDNNSIEFPVSGTGQNADENMLIAESNRTKAEEDNNNIELLASGTGKNADEAITMALKNAIEQAFGAFVSANTLILNDEIVQDQIATVSSGNINSYDVLSTNTLPDGLVSVNLRTSVSLSNLISYAESHGSSVELAGQTFIRNVKLKKLNQKNEAVALLNLFEQLSFLQIYDYELATNLAVYGNDYNLQMTIQLIKNPNFQTAVDLIFSTLASLSLSPEEVDSWEKDGFDTYTYSISLSATEKTVFYLRNDDVFFYNYIASFFHCAEAAWLIQFDNSQHTMYGPFDPAADWWLTSDNALPLMIKQYGKPEIYCSSDGFVIEKQTSPLTMIGSITLSETELEDIKNIEIIHNKRFFHKHVDKLKRDLTRKYGLDSFSM